MLKQSIHVIFALAFLELFRNSCSHESQDIYVKQYDSVIFDCIIDTTGTPKWKHGEDILFLGNHALGTHSREGIKLCGNYSLIIDPVTLSDEGVYECTASASTTIEKYNLTVIVPAYPFVTIEGQNGTNFVYVEENEAFIAVCHAVGSKPASKLAWYLNGHMLNNSKAKFDISINRQNNRTFDSVSTTKHSPHELTGNITCIAYGVGWRKQQATLMFATFVNPKIYLSINGIKNKTAIFVSGDQETNIVCSAKGARPRDPRKQKHKCHRKLYISYLFDYGTDRFQKQERKPSETTFSLNMLPPESIMRNEYSRESDIWVLAVAIWEIISFGKYGKHPFPEDGDKAGVCNIETKRPTSWPHLSFPFRNKSVIFDCWSKDVTLRPVLKLLKAAFEEVLGPKSLNDPVCTETNIYSSMEENMTSKPS
ncbi:Tyrosine-protein kinase isoform SRK1 [Holothuria leucospilota]|uniref:Tyrosine-protein kinase isoform SRK1 n=1 Tax=Holothuria leucospilota TaxID=206669 RepID=A0A9Q1BJI4_HOLLE|nr:Tyrosine-protein kinase isoform SRK1 [Holothuria leucospilota]